MLGLLVESVTGSFAQMAFGFAPPALRDEALCSIAQATLALDMHPYGKNPSHRSYRLFGCG